MACAFFHTASVSRPSSTGGCAARTAIALAVAGRVFDATRRVVSARIADCAAAPDGVRSACAMSELATSVLTRRRVIAVAEVSGWTPAEAQGLPTSYVLRPAS